MRYKRGAVEVQFNWIFVLIVGAIILILFSSIILRQKNISETSKNALVLKSLDAILSGAEVSGGTVNIVKIPETKIDFRCNRYSIDKLSKQLDVMNVFAPSTIQGDRLITLTKDFSIPYRASNLVYLTSPHHRYSFLGAPSELKTSIPEDIFSDFFVSLEEISYRGEKKSRFIFFASFSDIVPAEFVRLKDGDVSALKITGNLDFGTLEFFQKQGSSFVSVGTSKYLTEEALIGAIFSDSSELYDCAMDNVFRKANIITQIYIERTQSLVSKYSSSQDRCLNFANTAYSLNALETLSVESSDFSTANIESMFSASSLLKNQNKQAQLQSCSTIY
ncbi:hypothetical protein ISS07_01380 [Candidatus Woesearchaeota archaeon]|nr:hypothetical protein [Candidatus Woesearchaeota archaeon]